MKRIIFKTIAIITVCVAGLSMAAVGQKKTTQKKTPERWVKVYRDLWLGDQSNSTVGQFLKTATGQAILVDDVDKFQKEIAMVFFSEYQGNFQTLTFPGNARDAAYFSTDNITVFTRNPGGLDHWDRRNLNTGYIAQAVSSQTHMSPAEFDGLASEKAWKIFARAFRRYTPRSSKGAGTSNFVHVQPDVVYIFRLNKTVRGFIYVKKVIPRSSKGGSMQFDMIIEGCDEYSQGSAKLLQPAKD